MAQDYVPNQQVEKVNSEQKSKKRERNLWTPEQKSSFERAIREHGVDIDKITEVVGSKTKEQVKRRIGWYKDKRENCDIKSILMRANR